MRVKSLRILRYVQVDKYVCQAIIFFYLSETNTRTMIHENEHTVYQLNQESKFNLTENDFYIILMQ